MKLTPEQYKKIVTVIMDDPKLLEVWKKKILYIHTEYLKKISDMLDTIPQGEAMQLHERLMGETHHRLESAEQVCVVVAGLSLFDSLNNMAADILSEGEMRIVDDK